MISRSLNRRLRDLESRFRRQPMGREVEWVNRFLAHAAVDGGGRGLGMLAGLKSQVVQQIRGIAA